MRTFNEYNYRKREGHDEIETSNKQLWALASFLLAEGPSSWKTIEKVDKEGNIKKAKILNYNTKRLTACLTSYDKKKLKLDKGESLTWVDIKQGSDKVLGVKDKEGNIIKDKQLTSVSAYVMLKRIISVGKELYPNRGKYDLVRTDYAEKNIKSEYFKALMESMEEYQKEVNSE